MSSVWIQFPDEVHFTLFIFFQYLGNVTVGDLNFIAELDIMQIEVKKYNKQLQ